MKARNSRFSFSLLLAIVVAACSAVTKAAEKPVAIVSINNTEALFADVEYLLEATGTAGVGQIFLPQAKNYLQGVDSKKPIGIIISLDGMEPKPLAFVPVEDLETVLETIEDQVGEAKNAGDDIYELQGPQPMYIKEVNGWAFLAMSTEELEDTPANPAALLKGLDKTHDIAIRGFIQNIPQPLREMAVDNIKAQMEQANADEAQAALAETQVEQIEKFFEEGDELTFGWNIDSKSKSTYFDFAVKAKAGTDLAKQLNASKNMKSKYNGFLVPDAAISTNVASVIDEKSMDQMVTMLRNLEETALEEIENDDDIEDDAIRDGAKKLLSGVFDILKDTVNSGKMDAAMSVILEEKSMTMALASHVADGAKAEELVKELVELAKLDDEVEFSKLKLDSGKHGDVRLHELGIKIPEDEYVGEVLGGELEVCIGASKNDVYLALGVNPTANLKKMIDKSKSASGAKTLPATMVVKLSPILRFASAMEGDQTLSGMADMLSKSGNDHIRIQATNIDNGISYRFQVEEGILKMMGQLGAMRGGGGF